MPCVAQEFYLQTLNMDMGALIFAIMYIIGLGSMFQMYMPGVGQRQAQRPTWDKLRDAILFGQVTTLTHEWRMMMKKKKNERSSAAAKLIEKRRTQRREAAAERRALKGSEQELQPLGANGTAQSPNGGEKTNKLSRLASSIGGWGGTRQSHGQGKESMRGTDSADTSSGNLRATADQEAGPSAEPRLGRTASERESEKGGSDNSPIALDDLDKMLDTSFRDVRRAATPTLGAPSLPPPHSTSRSDRPHCPRPSPS